MKHTLFLILAFLFVAPAGFAQKKTSRKRKPRATKVQKPKKNTLKFSPNKGEVFVSGMFYPKSLAYEGYGDAGFAYRFSNSMGAGFRYEFSYLSAIEYPVVANKGEEAEPYSTTILAHSFSPFFRLAYPTKSRRWQNFVDLSLTFFMETTTTNFDAFDDSGQDIYKYTATRSLMYPASTLYLSSSYNISPEFAVGIDWVSVTVLFNLANLMQGETEITEGISTDGSNQAASLGQSLELVTSEANKHIESKTGQLYGSVYVRLPRIRFAYTF